MTPHLELGIGLIIGALATGLIFWGINIWRSNRVFTSTESAKTLSVAETILDEVDIVCVILDENAAPVFTNQLAREYDNPGELRQHLVDPRMHAIIFEVLTTGQPFIKEPDKNAKQGSPRLRILKLDNRHVIAIADDVGATNRLHEMRRDFIANMSHELKTPIAAISLLSDAISKGAEDPDLVRRFTNKLGKETRRLGELSHDVIRLSEAQAPLASSEREPVDLAVITAQECGAHKEIARQNEVTIEFANLVKRGGAATVLGRESSLRAAIANLIANAVAHSPTGAKVAVTVSANANGYKVAVRDWGAGIDAKYHARIFERFFRVDPARGRKIGGTGLGLSIVRNAANTHGGEVTVRSSVGKGATFELYIPAMLPKSSRRKEPLKSKEPLKRGNA